MMKKNISKFACLFCTLAVVFTTCGWIPFAAPVTIHSSPEGAEIYLEGGETPIGVTPYKDLIFISDKVYEVRMDKYHSQTVELNYDSAEDIFVELIAKPILVYSSPTAELYADGSGTSMGKTPINVDVLKEDRTYILKAKDYYDQEVTIGLNTENPLVIEMEHRPIITLSTIQNGVEIYENGTFIGNAPMTEEILKPRSFELRKEGYFKKTVTLTSSSPYQVTEELVPLPIIEIKTTPIGATVYLFGESTPLGKSPLKLTVEEKTSFEVKAPRYYSETFTVEAKSQLATVNLKAMPYVTISSTPSGAQLFSGTTSLGTTPIELLIEKETTYELRADGDRKSVV